jgi:hypothetical protein
MLNLSYSGAGEYSYSSMALRRYFCFIAASADGVGFTLASSFNDSNNGLESYAVTTRPLGSRAWLCCVRLGLGESRAG